jgi:oligopeptidase B
MLLGAGCTDQDPNTEQSASTGASAIAALRADPFAATAGVVPPMAAKQPQQIVQHGQTRIDDYAWLKDDNWQAVLRDPGVLKADVRAHLETEIGYYDALMSEEALVRERLFAEMRGRIKEADSTVPIKHGPFEYYVRYRDGGEYPIFARAPAGGGAEEILLDGDAEAAGSAFFAVAAVEHSPDHSLSAYGVDRLGSEYYAIRFRRLADDTELTETIDSTSGEIVWASDSRSVLYVERDDNQRPKRVKRHVLGTDPAADELVYDEPDDGMFVAIAKSQSGDYVFIDISDQVTSEVHWVPAEDTAATPTMIAPRLEGQRYSVEHHGAEFFIVTDADGAVDSKIVRAPIANPGRESWVEWLAHEPGAEILDFVPYESYHVRLENEDALPRIVVADYEGNEHEIDFDEDAYNLDLSAGEEYATTLTRFVYDSPSQPEQTFDYDMQSRERTLRKTREIPSGHDSNLYVVERIAAEVADGARIPITILRLAATPVDGTAPLLLYGYGSYGLSMPAAFDANVLPLVDRGVIYAIAHVRGGAERGRQWYLDAKLDKKSNTFTDFVAAAETLVTRRYTAAKRIVISGRSAGGLLVAAAVNLRPDLFAGVLAGVPFVDVLNTMSDESLPLTPPEWPEWGDPIRTREGYDWIMTYSPYDNIKQGISYPPIFATGGLADYRVTYWEPAKWIARLRDEAAGGPFVLWMNMEAGHFGAAARFQVLEEEARFHAFALKVLGLTAVAPVIHAR